MSGSSRPLASPGLAGTAGVKAIAVSAEQLHGDVREQAWHHITSTADRFAKYEQKTDRELSVVRLRTQPNPKP
jgi:hypothetical protein